MRDITQLHPRLQRIIAEIQPLWANAGLTVGIGECLRTVEEQDALYAQGRTTPGEIITYARGSDYQSQHQWGIAFDFYQNISGNAYPDVSTGFWDNVASIAKAHGLAWGGDWDSFKDRPHLYLPDWGDTPTLLKQQYGTPEAFFATWDGSEIGESGMWCWMGWTPKESLYDYTDPRGLYINGDAGRAYGRYQFDYEFGLVPFMQACYDYNPSVYGDFLPYINLGAGNEQLKSNTALHQLFTTYTNRNFDEFQYLQDKVGIDQYLQPCIDGVKNSYGIDITTLDPTILGTAFSMAIRGGYGQAISGFAGTSGLDQYQLLGHLYDYMANLHYDAGRWISGTSISQRDLAESAFGTTYEVYLIPWNSQEPQPTPRRSKKLPVWMMLRNPLIFYRRRLK